MVYRFTPKRCFSDWDWIDELGNSKKVLPGYLDALSIGQRSDGVLSAALA